MHHLPNNTPAEDISDGLVNLGFDFISVKHDKHSSVTFRVNNNQEPHLVPHNFFLEGKIKKNAISQVFAHFSHSRGL